MPGPALGTNLSFLAEFSSEFPLLNHFSLSRSWFSSLPDDEIELDENGWIVDFSDNNDTAPFIPVSTQLFSGGGVDRPAGRYILDYDGEGVMTIGGNAEVIDAESTDGRFVLDLPEGDNASFTVNIFITDPDGTGDYIRNIRLYEEQYSDLIDAGEVFNPVFIDAIEDFRSLRFMEWMDTNDSLQSEWTDRPTLTDARITEFGASVELMVQLANETHTDPWFTLPHLATDDYMQQFATYVRDNLDPGLVARFEFSNEVWNVRFDQARWSGEQAEALWGADRLFGDTGDDRLYGGQGDDEINGGDDNDFARGGVGNDVIHGDLGDDTLRGDAGDDELHGDEGNDRVSGNDGIDFLYGNAGDDRLWGDAGDDHLFGGTGADFLRGYSDNDTIHGGDGDDVIGGEDGNDELHGDDGNDLIFARDGNDTAFGGAGDDRIYGGLGGDTLNGGADNDFLRGEGGDDTLNGDDGDDILRGDEGSDTLNGGAGVDTLSGNNGADFLNGGADNDRLYGNADTDTFIFTDGFGDDTIFDFANDELEKIDLSGVTNITSFADVTANLSEANGNAIISDGTDSIIIRGVAQADLTENDFLF